MQTSKLFIVLCIFSLSFANNSANANDYLQSIKSPYTYGSNGFVHNSDSPSIFQYSESKIISDNTGSFLSAVINPFSVPSVSTRSSSTSGSNMGILSSSSATGNYGITSSLTYTLNVSGAPSTFVPISILSAYTLNTNNYGRLSSSSASVGLSVSFDLGSERGNLVEFTANASRGYRGSESISYNLQTINYIDGNNLNFYSGNPSNEYTEDFNIIASREDRSAQELSSITNWGLDVDQSLEGLFWTKLDANGFSSLKVSIFSNTQADLLNEGFAIAESFIDPYFSIDPAYLLLNPNAKLTLPLGVGNDNPLDLVIVTDNPVSAVPAPAAVWLFASGLPIFFGLRKRVAKPLS